MAAQAFALSPIAARASLPSEEDYDAIREAFMETARGRWFLDEYAKRNRNADTSMVLDAVSRIEETMAAQRQPPPPVVIDRLPEALKAIRSALEKAEGTASAAFDAPWLEESLAPIRKGTRIIKEISWRWREIGADSRICDLIDSQVAGIEAGCSRIAESDPHAALRAAFEIIRTEVEAFRGGDAEATPATEAAAPAPAVHEVARAPVAMDEATDDVEAAFDAPEMDDDTDVVEAADLSVEDAEDEAVLDMVAFEMAAPDPDDADDPLAESEFAHVATPPLVEPVAVAAAPEPELPPVAPPAPALQPSLQPTPWPAPEPDAEPSLGSTLIARGILHKPSLPGNDPLAAIRRMTQAEKIALFS